MAVTDGGMMTGDGLMTRCGHCQADGCLAAVLSLAMTLLCVKLSQSRPVLLKGAAKGWQFRQTWKNKIFEER